MIDTINVVTGWGLAGFFSSPWLALVWSAILVTFTGIVTKTRRPTNVTVHRSPKPSRHVDTMLAACDESGLLNFRPPRLLTNGNLSTVYSSLGKRAIPPPYERIHLILPCGGTLGIDIVEPGCPWNRRHVATPPQIDNPPTVIILPGLGGSSHSKFVRSTVRTFYEQGWRVAVLNYRGCGTKLTSPKTFTAGSTEDLCHALEYLKRHYSETCIMAVGFSMGANVLTRFLGSVNEDKSHPLYKSIAAAATFSNTFMIRWMYDAVATRSPLMRVYERALLRHATRPWKQCANLDQLIKSRPGLDANVLTRAKSFWDYDSHHVPIIHGYKDLDEYSEAESSGNYLRHVGVPLFIMNARDDPLFFDKTEELVSGNVHINPNLLFVVTEWGGHNGWDRRLVPSMKTKQYQSLMESVAEHVLTRMADSIAAETA